MTGRLSGHKPVAGTTDWLTPPEIIESLGPFDLDPCASDRMPWRTAHTMWTTKDDGLSKPWWDTRYAKKFVWLNPPYGREADAWLQLMAEHNHGLALLFCRTETKAWHRNVWYKASAILFLRGRLHFHYPDGSRAAANAGASSAIVAYGEKAMLRLRSKHARKLKGRRVYLNCCNWQSRVKL